jgi:cobalt transporter subunit CbtB
MLSPTMSTAAAIPTIKIATAAQALLAAMLGVTLLWAVGFSQISVLHNAAHDTRHSNAFPCH